MRRSVEGKMSMSDRTESTAKDQRKLEAELAALIEAAQKQPGIAELMRVYRHCAKYDNSMQAQRRYQGIQRLSVASDSSR